MKKLKTSTIIGNDVVKFLHSFNGMDIYQIDINEDCDKKLYFVNTQSGYVEQALTIEADVYQDAGYVAGLNFTKE